jgi:gas vesicle protein
MNRNGWSAMITGITIGLGVGAALGILFAPQSGEDTRDYIMGAAKDRINDAKDRFSDVGDRVRDVRDQFSNVVESGKDFARQAQKSVDHVKGHLEDLADAGQRAYREATRS